MSDQVELAELPSADVAEAKTVVHRGHVILVWMQQQGLDRTKLANATGHTRNTIGDLLKKNVESQPHVVRNVLRVLGREEEELLATVKRWNGEGASVIPLRPFGSRDRDYDKDPDKDDAHRYADRIVELPRDAQMAVFNIVRALETAYRKT